MIVNNYLIRGETFFFQDKLDISQVFLSDNEINEKYKKGEIRIVTEQARYPLDSIEPMLDSQKYILNPEYQRRKRWDNTRKSRLIESFILNVPIPPIFLYEIDYSIYEVIDGLQRLTAIYDFYKGKFNLEGLEYWQELNGRNYKNLPEQIKKGIDRRYLSSIVLLQETAKNIEEAAKLKQIVFERLNSGGEKLTPQETRNALFNGKFNQLCIKLAKNSYFRKMWKLPLESEGEEKLLKNELYRKMEDVELVLRFFAYRHIDKYKSPLDEFLDNYLKQANNYPDATIKELENLFNQTIDLVERRNQIAHGSERLDNILDISELEPYVYFLEQYCQAIFEILSEELIKKESMYKFQKIEKIIKIFNNKILAFEVENYTIKVGDVLIVETIEGNFFKRNILTIGLNNELHTELTITEKTNIAISVEPHIKENQKFYIIKQ